MLTIRRYVPTDFDTVIHLHIFALQNVGAYLGRGPWDDDIYAIEESYLNKQGEFLVGEYEGQLVAMGAFRRTSSTYAEIKRVRVHPDYQGRGLGQAMLAELERYARAMGYTTLHLDTSTIQIAAQKLYEKQGFREVGRKIERNLEEILYVKELS